METSFKKAVARMTHDHVYRKGWQHAVKFGENEADTDADPAYYEGFADAIHFMSIGK